MTRVQANLVLLLAGAMWGMGFIAQSTAMDAIGPFLFVGLRFLFATLAMLPFALREASKAPDALASESWIWFASIGLLLFGAMAAQQVGLLTTTVTNSGFLTGLYVVMVPFLAVLLFRQWPHPVVWPAAFCALAGIWLLSGGSVSRLTTGDWLTVLVEAPNRQRLRRIGVGSLCSDELTVIANVHFRSLKSGDDTLVSIRGIDRTIRVEPQSEVAAREHVLATDLPHCLRYGHTRMQSAELRDTSFAERAVQFPVR